MCQNLHQDPVQCNKCDDIVEHKNKRKVACKVARRVGVKCPDQDCSPIYAKAGYFKTTVSWVFCNACNGTKDAMLDSMPQENDIPKPAPVTTSTATKLKSKRTVSPSRSKYRKVTPLAIRASRASTKDVELNDAMEQLRLMSASAVNSRNHLNHVD